MFLHPYKNIKAENSRKIIYIASFLVVAEKPSGIRGSGNYASKPIYIGATFWLNSSDGIFLSQIKEGSNRAKDLSSEKYYKTKTVQKVITATSNKTRSVASRLFQVRFHTISTTFLFK